MNQNDVAKREVLEFQDFLKKVHDNTYKPFSKENQHDSSDKSGLHNIKREPAYDHVGYADSVFAGVSKIDSPGYRLKLGDDSGIADATGQSGIFNMGTNESDSSFSPLKRLYEF
jgi:hypothetical protein